MIYEVICVVLTALCTVLTIVYIPISHKKYRAYVSSQNQGYYAWDRFLRFHAIEGYISLGIILCLTGTFLSLDTAALPVVPNLLLMKACLCCTVACFLVAMITKTLYDTFK